MQTKATPPPRNTRQAITLLRRAARSEQHHVWKGCVWLIVAALLEAAGPLLGKYFIDHTLVPRRFDMLEVGGLLGGILCAGALASVIPCLLYTSPSPRDRTRSRMPSSA